eukprot:XP_001700593.1 predicted protein [Chlamydomonas reinhardtii]
MGTPRVPTVPVPVLVLVPQHVGGLEVAVCDVAGVQVLRRSLYDAYNSFLDGLRTRFTVPEAGRPKTMSALARMVPTANHGPVLERKLNKVLTNQGKMQKDIGDMQKDISQLKQDTAVNKALVAVNLTPMASLVLGVLYFLYTNSKVLGGS